MSIYQLRWVKRVRTPIFSRKIFIFRGQGGEGEMIKKLSEYCKDCSISSVCKSPSRFFTGLDYCSAKKYKKMQDRNNGDYHPFI